MKNLSFTSLHGTALTGNVSKEMNVKNERVYIVRKLNRMYAVVDGYSVLEMPDNTDMVEFNKQIISEL